MLFDVAPADAHAVAAAALKAAGAHVPRACLLRRVVADFAAQPSFQNALAAGGLRGDRLSVWALQVNICPELVKMPASLCYEARWQDASQEACGAHVTCACPLQPTAWLGPAYQWCSVSRRLVHRQAVSHVLQSDKLFKYC